MSNSPVEIELLAPAKNLEFAIEAINCGADAVYIGANKFGARYAAGNSVDDIAKVVEYAHQFNVRVYVTLNTILFEDELQEAKDLAFELCGIGVDAFIVQDMAYMTFGLPIQLHASTQTSGYTLERVKFLEGVGFDRVVIERALSGEQIAEMCRECSVEIEAFVHGAICVSYSGVCYMGHIVSGRSGNRGVCSQPCRSTYNLYNEKGDLLIKNKHLLSVKDLMLSKHVGEMIEMGVKSFKIEGRLKDLSYLKNSVLHYRKEIDKYLKNSSSFVASSVGSGVCMMEVDLNKSFTRGFSDYYFKGKGLNVGSFQTAKAIGEYMGEVKSVGRDSFVIDSKELFSNGDGICFVARGGEFTGTNINVAQGEKIFPNRMDGIDVGAKIYRNFDIKYTAQIAKERVVRRIGTDLLLTFCEGVLDMKAQDETGVECEMSLDIANFEPPKNVEKMQKTLTEQFAKSGDTIFEVRSVEVVGELRFIPISTINMLRRDLLEKLKIARVNGYEKMKHIGRRDYVEDKMDTSYKINVTNSLSEKFYRECGYSEIDRGVEVSKKSFNGYEAMVMKYCLRGEMGECLKTGGKSGKLFLENSGNYFELITNCVRCEMKLVVHNKPIWRK